MRPPPGGQAVTQTRRNRVVGGKDTAVGAALVSRYVCIAMAQPELDGMSANKVSRIVRQFIAAGLHERDLVTYVVGYADPTGETAVRNVMAAARRTVTA